MFLSRTGLLRRLRVVQLFSRSITDTNVKDKKTTEVAIDNAQQASSTESEDHTAIFLFQ